MNAELITTLRDHREKLAAAAARALAEVSSIDELLSELENDAHAFEFSCFAGNGSPALGFAGVSDSDGPQEAA
jgi:hypothetical protein